MAYVIPNSTVILLANVALTPTYENSVDYTSKDTQYNDMYAHKIAEWDHVTYVGKNKEQGTIRVEHSNGNLMNSGTYLMFKNTSYENRWFYAFVNSIDFVNNVTWEIKFTLDRLQSYYFDFTYSQCLIERQHSTTDVPGDNLIDEGLETGEYLINYQVEADNYGNLIPCICTTLLRDGNTNEDGSSYSEVDGVQLGTTIYNYYKNGSVDKSAVAQFFTNASKAGESDQVVDVYMVPKGAFTEKELTDGVVSGDGPSPITKIQRPEVYGSLKGYTPRNKKLFTYPFCYLKATDNSGNTCNYRFELFSKPEGADHDNVSFQTNYSRLPNPEGYMHPVNYAGITDNYDAGISINDFPKGSYVIDGYKAWLAQTSNSRTLQQLGALAMGVAGVGLMATGIGSAAGAGVEAGALSTLVGGATTLAKGAGSLTGSLALLAKQEDHKVNGQRAMGNACTNALTVGHGHKLYLQSMCVQNEFAKIIDDFFDKYGYKQNIIATPNIKARPHWNYIKTVGCDVKASLPSESVAVINAIHDAGITFWKSLDEIGNYSLDNRIA